MNTKAQWYKFKVAASLYWDNSSDVGSSGIQYRTCGTEWQVMICLQSAEEGEKASVRGRVGQKLLDLSTQLKEFMLVILTTSRGCVLWRKSSLACLQTQGINIWAWSLHYKVSFEHSNIISPVTCDNCCRRWIFGSPQAAVCGLTIYLLHWSWPQSRNRPNLFSFGVRCQACIHDTCKQR